MSNRQAEKGHSYRSTKTYVHAKGLSCCFRQWRATDSHCRFLHGYSLQVKVEFEGLELDNRNWVMDFGGLKAFATWLEETFDHKTLVAKDDPALPYLQDMALPQIHRRLYMSTTTEVEPIIQLKVVDHVGMEEFARMIYEWLIAWDPIASQEIKVKRVWVNEHEANGASYGLVDCDYNRIEQLVRTGIREAVERRDSSRARTGI